MTVLVIDGPEGVGKTTLIGEIQLQLAPWKATRVREWGPIESWTEYLSPLAMDLANDQTLTIWQRGWPSEVVYNELLGRGRDIDEMAIRKKLENGYTRTRAYFVMLFAPEDVLQARREERVRRGETDDLDVDVKAERDRFIQYGVEHGWTAFDGSANTRNNATTIIRDMRRIIGG